MRLEDFEKMTPEEMSNAFGILVMNAYKNKHKLVCQKNLEEIYLIFKRVADKVKDTLKERYYE